MQSNHYSVRDQFQNELSSTSIDYWWAKKFHDIFT